MTTPVPALTRQIIADVVSGELAHATTVRADQPYLLLVHGRYQDGSPPEFAVQVGPARRRVRVSDEHSVLGAVLAWQGHLDSETNRSAVLVITTSVGEEIGWDLRGCAVRGHVITVDRVDLVRQRFLATDVDPRIRTAPWLVEALLEAEPPTGWPATGGLLTLDTAVGALVGARLGLDTEIRTGGLDADALLAWSQRPGASARFAELVAAEREGMIAWLSQQVGGAAGVLLRLATAGRAADAMALGELSGVLNAPAATAEAALAIGGLFGSQVRAEDLRELSTVVSGALARWVGDAEQRGPHSEAAARVLDVAQRAEELAAQAGITGLLTGSRLLPSALRSSAGALAAALAGSGSGWAPPDVAAAEAALVRVGEHSLTQLRPGMVRAAQMAVRLVRWLATAPGRPASVGEAVAGHARDWGWVDRALAVVWAGDPSGDESLSRAYRQVYDAARARRDQLDEQAAALLVGWVARAASPAPEECLLIEDVLERVAEPLATAGPQPPLILVLDGMSSAVAAGLGEQLQERAWYEISSSAGSRLGAVSVLPSLTRLSRTSLLTGALAEGDQTAEATGFAQFWRARRRDAVLFHKADLAGEPGSRLAAPLVQALADDRVVGVVLNTIDDALDRGREGDRTGWRLEDVTYLPELLDAARDYGRPVLLVSDHGHVLDRSRPGEAPSPGDGAESARWRTGVAGVGEVELAGPRVLAGGGRVVLPWREDIRYLPRRAGYHGGASLAEITVPILVLVASAEGLPAGWSVLSPEATVPSWWGARPPVQLEAVAEAARAQVQQAGRSRAAKPVRAPQGESLFDAVETTRTTTPAAVTSLGARVVSGEVYAAQKAFLRKAPAPSEVAGVIDALVAAGGTLSLAAVATLAGRSGRNPEFLAAALQRLLNVEGYQVLGIVDDGRTVNLNVPLLREQFEVDG